MPRGKEENSKIKFWNSSWMTSKAQLRQKKKKKRKCVKHHNCDSVSEVFCCSILPWTQCRKKVTSLFFTLFTVILNTLSFTEKMPLILSFEKSQTWSLSPRAANKEICWWRNLYKRTDDNESELLERLILIKCFYTTIAWHQGRKCSRE